MVELGTGYYCEKTNDKAIELIERKIALVNSSIETVEGVCFCYLIIKESLTLALLLL